MKVVVFLRWPERCFRANARDLEFLRSLLPARAEVVEAKSERAFLRSLPTATHVITWYFRPEWFALAPKLKVLATPAAGRELVPTTGPAGVRIHFGHYHGAIMAESVAAFVLAWARGFFLPQPEVWPRTWMGSRCREVAGTRAVVLGYGHVGRAIGAKLAALGVAVEGFSRHRPLTPAALKALKPDWFVCALPGDTGTDDCVNAKLLAALPRTAVLVNVGRGNAVDEAALERALRSGRLAGAYLDVLKYEPHYKRCFGFTEPERQQSGAFIARQVPNCVVMPHASAFSEKYVRRCFQELKDDGFI